MCFDVFGDERGSLVAIEGGRSIPFDIKRIFYIYKTNSDKIRGQHANKKSEFIIINVSGTAKIRITDGNEEKIIILDNPNIGVYIPKIIWKEMYDFSEDSVMLILSNSYYDNAEYIRDYKAYLKEVKEVSDD